jgi:hypothetical protein
MADDVYKHAIIQMSFGDDSCLFTHIMVRSVTTLVLGDHTYFHSLLIISKYRLLEIDH